MPLKYTSVGSAPSRKPAAVKVRAVHAGELHLAAHSEAAAAAHPGAVDHNGVHADGGGDAVLLCQLTGKLHHHQGADGKDVVELDPALDELLQLAGDETVIAIGAVVGADMKVGAGVGHLLLQDDDVLRLKAADQVHLVARLVQGTGHAMMKTRLGFS